MSSPTTSLPENVHASFEKLRSAADALNSVSDELGKSISRIDESLKKLNLGLTVWLVIHSWDDFHLGGHSYAFNEVGYAKINGRWGIGLKSVKGNQNDPDGDNEELWLFNDAPRRARLDAIEQINKLLEKLAEAAAAMTAQMHAKLEEVIAVANIISPPQLLPPLRPRPLTGVSKSAEVK